MARGPRLAANRLAFGYEIVGGQGLPWRPVRVFDDGQHVYIQMLTALQASEAPALLVQSRGESALVNYALLLSIISVGVQLSQIPDFGRASPGRAPGTSSVGRWDRSLARPRASGSAAV